ncbi:hypothetical protein FRC17_008170 [Serendipita sp. 399]|nr:hypothetical protein FRC17_008170 [Serendipita sp. 399]
MASSSYSTALDSRKLDMIKSQAEFSRLLVVCRALQPFVEKILYSYVHIKPRRLWDGNFERGALGLGVLGDRRRGEWTREIWIESPHTSEEPWGRPYSLDGIPVFQVCRLCPNLRDYTLDTKNSVKLEVSSPFQQDDAQVISRESRVQNLWIFDWVVRLPQLLAIPLQFTALQSLSIRGKMLGDDVFERICFPNLRRLNLDLMFFTDHLVSLMDMPKLEALTLKLTGEGEALLGLLARRNSNLKFLSIFFSCHPLLNMHARLASLLSSILSATSTAGLQSLAVRPDSDTFANEPTSYQFPPETLLLPKTVVSHPLQRLSLVIEGFLAGNDARAKGLDEASIELLKTAAKEAAPGAEIEWEDASMRLMKCPW